MTFKQLLELREYLSNSKDCIKTMNLDNENFVELVQSSPMVEIYSKYAKSSPEYVVIAGIDIYRKDFNTIEVLQDNNLVRVESILSKYLKKLEYPMSKKDMDNDPIFCYNEKHIRVKSHAAGNHFIYCRTCGKESKVIR